MSVSRPSGILKSIFLSIPITCTVVALYPSWLEPLASSWRSLQSWLGQIQILLQPEKSVRRQKQKKGRCSKTQSRARETARGRQREGEGGRGREWDRGREGVRQREREGKRVRQREGEGGREGEGESETEGGRERGAHGNIRREVELAAGASHLPPGVWFLSPAPLSIAGSLTASSSPPSVDPVAFRLSFTIRLQYPSIHLSICPSLY